MCFEVYVELRLGVSSTEQHQNGEQWKRRDEVTEAYVFTGTVCFLHKASPKINNITHAVKVKAIFASRGQ
jgi:hypothetical protein